MGKQGNLALVHANCCRIAYEAGQQSQQAKVEELQKRIDDSIFILSTIDNPDEAYKAIDLLLRALRGEQALKGDQYDEHRKKAEEAISKGASLTNHRIEL
ncbi:hypothetical protein NQ847_06655 [Acinetobacter baumannii]|nr:hypothetical protein [Acinetobacter baumannii]